MRSYRFYRFPCSFSLLSFNISSHLISSRLSPNPKNKMSNTTNDTPSTTTITPSATTQSYPPPQYYFCYQCNRTISLTPPSSSSSDISCPYCNGGFLEEVENPNPNPNLHLVSSPFFSPPSSSVADQLAPFAPFLFPPTSSPLDPIDLPSLFNPRSPFHDHPDAFNPLHFLQNYLQTMRAGGANIQFVVENADHPAAVGVGGGNIRVPAHLGDYFFGPGLEQLIQQLAENDPNRYGTPPAAKTAVEGLPSVNMTEDLLRSDSSQCAVCMGEFELGAEAKQMPCNHFFHSSCILPWLELHNSCPICRHELPTDDPDYEQRVRARGDNAGSGNNGNGDGDVDGGFEEGSPNDRTVERRFRISLPWPFGSPGNAAEGNNTSGSESNPGRR